MVLVKIEPKEAVRFIKLRQSFPHSWDMGGTEEGEEGYGAALRGSMCVCFICVCISVQYMYYFICKFLCWPGGWIAYNGFTIIWPSFSYISEIHQSEHRCISSITFLFLTWPVWMTVRSNFQDNYNELEYRCWLYYYRADYKLELNVKLSFFKKEIWIISYQCLYCFIR